MTSGIPNLAAAPAVWPRAIEIGDQLAFPAVLMRGGTSKGAFLKPEDLPQLENLRDRVILAAYGSPDPRQVDGVGGANPLTSKLAIVSASQRDDADVDYLFGQVRIGEPVIDYSGTCGNLLSAVGPFALDEGVVAANEPTTRIRIHLVNTGQIVVAEVPVLRGRARAEGTCEIAGVLGTGASIVLDFSLTAGTLGRGLLPTGLASERLTLASGAAVQVSIVDAANPCVFVAAEDLGLDPATLLGETLDDGILDELQAIRSAAAVRLGLVESADRAAAESPAIPKVYVVHPPVDFVDRYARPVSGSDVTVLGRGLSMGRPHAAYALSAAICTGAAASIPGTVVAMSTEAGAGAIRIGHPSGVSAVEVDVRLDPSGDHSLLRASVERTARRLMSGLLYVPASILAEA
jgi:hypothetical protein